MFLHYPKYTHSSQREGIHTHVGQLGRHEHVQPRRQRDVYVEHFRNVASRYGFNTQVSKRDVLSAYQDRLNAYKLERNHHISQRNYWLNKIRSLIDDLDNVGEEERMNLLKEIESSVPEAIINENALRYMYRTLDEEGLTLDSEGQTRLPATRLTSTRLRSSSYGAKKTTTPTVCTVDRIQYFLDAVGFNDVEANELSENQKSLLCAGLAKAPVDLDDLDEFQYLSLNSGVTNVLAGA